MRSNGLPGSLREVIRTGITQTTLGVDARFFCFGLLFDAEVFRTVLLEDGI